MSAAAQLRSFSTILVLTLSLPRIALAQPDEVSQLLTALTSGSEGERLQAATRLYHLGQVERAVPALVSHLRAADPNERCLSARLLGLLRSPTAVAPLVAALGDDDWALRRDAVEALGQIRHGSATAALERCLDDPEARVRIAASRSLAELEHTRALPAVLAREPSSEVRLHLVEALLHDESAAAGQALRRALRDDSESVRLLAATVLVERGDPAGIPLLAARVQGGTATSRQEALAALGHATGAARGQAGTVLLDAMGSEDLMTALAAAAALARLGDRRGLARLRAIARGPHPAAIRAHALALLDELEAQPPDAPPR